MNNNQPDTCHCIVRHPDKPKFLVVKHEESWSPPVLMFPPGQVDFKAGLINQGMKEKYGLSTRVLRPIMHLKNYHCIEMELAQLKPSKNLQAVWVDQAEYLRTRSDPGDVPDPFEIWLKERELGQVPAKRAPFHQPGWFEKAEHWIQFQLDSIGQQVIGSVEQFRVGWTDSCLLRVRTNNGLVYFKAGFGSGPVEARLVSAMAGHWPGIIFKPLATDVHRNWMLNQDYGHDQAARLDLNLLPEFARTMAGLQLNSVKYMDEWRSLGCQDYSLERMLEFCKDPSQHKQRLQEAGGGLTDAEWDDFCLVLKDWTADCQALADYKLPMTLVHPDFRDDNMVRTADSCRLIDWSDTAIAHPFLVMNRINHDSRRFNQEKEPGKSLMRISPELQHETQEAYLGCFTEFGTLQELGEAMRLADRLVVIWSIMRTLHRVEGVEQLTPHYYYLVVSMQESARKLIERKPSA